MDTVTSYAERGATTGGRRAFCMRHIVTFEDTNLMGNVYYVRHLVWQGRCRELFLCEHAPSVLQDLAAGLRLVTLAVECEYFDELRPFEEVEIRMTLAEQVAHRIRLAFEYVVDRNGSATIAARGFQQIGCMRVSGGDGVPCNPPTALVDALNEFR